MNAKPSLRLLLFAALLNSSGCGLTARDGPTTSAIMSAKDQNLGYDLIEVGTDNIGQLIAPRRGGDAALNAGATPQASILPGDTLQVSIYERSDGGLFAAMALGGSNFVGLRVDETGNITLPYAGRIRVWGLRTAEIEDKIRTSLKGTAVDPQVRVQLMTSPRNSVLVTGEVKTPGHVTMLDGPLSVIDAIARSGGPSVPAYTADAIIYTGGGVRRVPYLSLLSQPTIYLSRGDQVILETNIPRFVAMGALEKPGLQDMVSPRMSLLDGLAQAGGLRDTSANPDGVFLFRLPPDGRPGRPKVFHLNFAKAEAMLLARQLTLQADDVVFVSNAPVWETQKIIVPIVQTLIIGRSTTSLSGN